MFNKSNHDQIPKDVSRSALIFYGRDSNSNHNRDNLGQILHSIFDDAQDMYYIQGFNDVVSVFYTVCNNQDLARKLSQKVASTFLKDYIMNNSSKLSFNAFKIIFKIIKNEDNQIYELFTSIDSVCVLSFAVSWLLTWFAHDVKNINIISRIYDYCLSSHESISLYLSAALLIYFKKELLDQITDDISLHVFFQSLEWEKINYDKWISKTEQLFNKYPPKNMADSSLSNISNISNISIEMDLDEIKEDDNDISDSKAVELMDSSSSSLSEYSSDFTPSSDQNEDFKQFDINVNDEYEKENNQFNNNNANNKPICKQKRVSSKLSRLDFFDSLQTIPDALTHKIDDIMSIFDKKKSKKNKAVVTVTNST